MAKRQKVLHWIGKLKVEQGELEHGATVLVAASTLDDAFDVLGNAARTFYGSDDTPRRDDDRYVSHDGGVIVTAMSLRRIEPEVFDALRVEAMVRLGPGLSAEDIERTKLPTGGQGLQLLEAFEAYGASLASHGRATGGADQLLVECRKRALAIRESLA